MSDRVERTINPSESDSTRPSLGYEYLDHTADVQIHSWGSTLREAFEQSALAVYGYMTDLQTVEPEISEFLIRAEGHDLESLLYGFLDECLYNFVAEPYFVAQSVEIIDFNRWSRKDDEDTTKTIVARCSGATFNPQRHVPGTEIKAITYSAMQIIEKVDFAEIFVIVDI